MTGALLGTGAIVGALVLDVFVGDPQFRLHPVRLIGNLASAAEKGTRRFFPENVAGIVTWLATVAVVLFAGWGLLVAAALVSPVLRFVFSVLFVYFSISARDLAQHAQRVEEALTAGNLESARSRTAMMVSRETAALDEAGVVRATVESLSENTGDGIAGPLLFAAVFGPLGAIVYRSINTMDAMFGYKNERYLRFGWFAARSDDIVNFLPARLTAISTCLVGTRSRPFRESWALVRRDARKHDSPNAGFPEAATAAVLGVQLGGRAVYFGTVHEKPSIGNATKTMEVSDIRRAVRLMWSSTTILAASAVLLRYGLLTIL